MSALQPVNAQAGDSEIRMGERLHFTHGISALIDRFPGRAFLVLSIVYFIAVLSLSSLKLLWLDELITLQIARLGSFAAIWQALERGVDPNPPVTHLLVHYSRMLLGDHEFAYRLPAMVGYWAGLAGLFLYLTRYLRPTWALAGTLLSMTMGAFEYSYESRSYGIFYGLAMVAFLCWCYSVERSKSSTVKWIALAGMTLALAASISTNYFAVLAFLPVAAGEITRTIVARDRISPDAQMRSSLSRNLRRSGIDFRVWVALLIAVLPLLAYRGMIAHSIAQFAPYAWNKVSIGQAANSYTEMVEIVLYPLLAVFVIAAIVALLRRRLSAICAHCRSRIVPGWMEPVIAGPKERVLPPVHELVAIGTLMAYPLLGYVLASIRGGMLSPRFVIPVCFGFAIAGAFVLFRLLGAFPGAGVATLCFLACWFLCRESYVGYWYEEQKECFYKVLDRLLEAEAHLPSQAPIVIPDPLLALTFQHYAPAPVGSRAVFPVDFPAIRYYRHDDSPEENLWAGRDFLYSLKILPLAEFQNAAGEYLIIAGDGNWLLQDLRRHEYRTQRLKIDTRAEAMGGFTPLAHGTPAFYVADGRRGMQPANCSPMPALALHRSDELPRGRPFPTP